MHHNTWCGVLLMAVCFVAGAMQPTLARDMDALRIGYSEPSTLDPHFAVSSQAQSIVRFLFRGLTRFAIRDGRVTTSEVDPDLAESWIEPDGDDLTWIFRLRRGVEFHKGFGELTAEDVKFSFERQLNNPKYMTYAKNLDVISSIEVINNRTLWITLKSPDPVFLLRVSGYQHGYIVSKKAALLYGEQFHWSPVGTGPFYFDERIADEKLVLKAHKSYRDPLETDGKPPDPSTAVNEVHWFDVRDDEMRLLGLQHGGFDIIAASSLTAEFIDSVKQMGAVIDKRGPGLQWNLFFNTSQKPFDDIKNRQAVMAAINRKAIQAASWGEDMSTLATSPLPPGYFGHTEVEIPPYDSEHAKTYWSRGAQSDLSRRPDYASPSLEHGRITELIQSQLRAAGIEWPLVTVEHTAYHERIRANLNKIVLYGATRITHGDVWLGLFFHSSQAPNPQAGSKGTNFSHFSGVDRHLLAARQAESDEERIKHYHEAQERLMRDAVVLPIAVVPNMSVRNRERVETPFDPEMGEFALHYFYNYPERFKLNR